jgi:transglutaminase-like putative cysteine protease
VQKSVLLVALLRAAGIPARLHFADMRNRLVPEELKALMGTDVFYFHGYVEARIEGAWRKVTPSFDRGTCERHGIRRVDWDGRSDSLLHPTDVDGRPQFEYLADRGPRDDLPFEEIMAVLLVEYPNYDGHAWGTAFKE